MPTKLEFVTRLFQLKTAADAATIASLQNGGAAYTPVDNAVLDADIAQFPGVVYDPAAPLPTTLPPTFVVVIPPTT